MPSGSRATSPSSSLAFRNRQSVPFSSPKPRSIYSWIADTPSKAENGEGYLLTRDAIEHFNDLYLPDREARTDPRASPLLAKYHTDLPRAWIQTAEYDPLRDEGRQYAEKLAKAGVQVEYKCYPGMVHGFARMGGKVDDALVALEHASGALRSAFDG